MTIQKASQISIADTVLARISAFNTEMLGSFIFEEGKQQLEELDCINHDLKELKEEIINILYETIPLVNDKKIVRAMIDLRRRLYNGKRLSIDKISNLNMIDFLAFENQIKFNNWLTLELKKVELEQCFQKKYQNHKTIEEELIYNVFKSRDHDFFKGLPIFNYKFSDFLMSRERKHWKIGSNLMKSSYTYFLRGTVKTSPLSTLTQLAVTSYDFETEKCNTTYFNISWARALVTMIFENTVLIPELSDLFSYKVTERIQNNDSNDPNQRIRGVYSAVNKVFSKTEDIVRFSQELEQLDEIGKGSLEYSVLIKSIKHPHPNEYLHYLIEQKLIRPVMPFSIEENQPFRSLSKHIRNHKCYQPEIHESICDLLEELDLIKDILTQIPNFEMRNQTMKKLKDKLNQILKILKLDELSWVKHSPIVYEDVRSNLNVPPLGEYVKNDIEKLQSHLKEFYYSHTLYEKLLDLFKERFGYGGETNLLAFLADILESETLYSSLINESREEDIKKVISGEHLTETKEIYGFPKTATIYYQIAANSYNDIKDGSYLLIVNKVTDGSGNIFTRFNSLFDEKNYHLPLEKWINKINRPANLYQVTYGEDWSNLQSRYGMIENYIEWVGELTSTDQYNNISVTELSLKHDIENDTLVIQLDGEPIRPIYLGSVPEHLTNELSKLFSTLIKPYFVRTPFGSNPLNVPRIKEEIVHIPRKQLGRVVLSREQWALPLSIIKEFFSNFKEDELMKRLHEWKVHNGIPNEVYITLTSSNPSFINNEKPFWFNFYNILSLDLLKKSMSDKYDVIIFTEALPSRKEQWFHSERKHYTTEFMTLGAIH